MRTVGGKIEESEERTLYPLSQNTTLCTSWLGTAIHACCAVCVSHYFFGRGFCARGLAGCRLHAKRNSLFLSLRGFAARREGGNTAYGAREAGDGFCGSNVRSPPHVLHSEDSISAGIHGLRSWYFILQSPCACKRTASVIFSPLIDFFWLPPAHMSDCVLWRGKQLLPLECC